MAKAKKVKKTKEAPSMYKGYSIGWLKEETEHPDYSLVAEYEKKYGEIK